MPVVLKPEMFIISLSFKDGAVDMKADTVLESLETKTVFWYESIVVSTEVTFFPNILLTETLKPPPFVFVLSNTAVSPTS